ncbi:MFS transporter [Leifsonia sp. NPDC058248]|uniref:MFS transporter n=1 Tax=Leifsonia sp. NPDC058248 TaxID=3346402 RepID=UPI0036D77A81
MTTAAVHSGSLIGPLRIAVFRWLWIAAVVSNIGTWMQTVGAQWLLLDQPNSTTLVALVQTASSLPILLLAIPAGVLGEFVDKRRLLIAVQGFQTVVGLALALLAWAGLASPAVTLLLTFLLGAGSAVQAPAYQALVPEIVPRSSLTDAAALSSIGVNIARAIGPALAGLLIAQVGVPFVFLLNALSFLFFMLVLLLWRTYDPLVHSREPFWGATIAGLRYTRNAPVVRRVLMRLVLFIVPANALWALLPLVAQQQLHLDATGYGLLLAALGVGSVLGALLLPRGRRTLGVNRATQLATALFGVCLVLLAVLPSLAAVLPVLLVAGVGWIWVIALLNGSIQTFLPAWVRSRGLSIYQIAFFGGTAAGATLSGVAAGVWGVIPVIVGAGVLLALVAASQFVWPLLATEHIDRSPAPMPLPEATFIPAAASAATLVLVRYTVPPDRVDGFFHAMSLVEQTRRRTGARSWRLYAERELPDAFVEAFGVSSWDEHLRQHERLTGADDENLTRVKELSTTEPEVTHLVAAAVGRRDR